MNLFSKTVSFFVTILLTVGLLSFAAPSSTHATDTIRIEQGNFGDLPADVQRVLEEQAYLKASNADQLDEFGHDVAISGDTLVVGVPLEDGDGSSPANNDMNNNGAVYVFVQQNGVWTQQAYLKVSDPTPGDLFGHSVAIDGDTLVVGAYLDDGDGTPGSDSFFTEAGAAYVFVRQNGVWTQQAYLKASNVEAGDWFGWDVAVSGNTLVVSAVQEDGDGSSSTDNSAGTSGAAYVFVGQSGIWTQQVYLKASNPDVGDRFGESVAISGDTLIVGAPSEDGNGSSQADNSEQDSGAAYVFDRQSGVWTQQTYLKASNPDVSDYFGVSVAADGDTLVVGEPYAQSTGLVHIFVDQSGVWTPEDTLVPSNPASNAQGLDGFGEHVAIDGDTVIVGAPDEDSNGTSPDDDSLSSAGAAYAFVRQNGMWTQQAYLKASNADLFDFFGSSVAVFGDTVVVGAVEEDGNGSSPDDNSLDSAGAAYVMTLTDTPATGEAPLRLYPADGQTVTAANSGDWQRFQFEHIDGAEWYGVWVGNDTTTGIYQWFPATATSSGITSETPICDTSTMVCTLPVDVWLADGQYSWWMTYWGPSLQDWNSYWNGTAFSVDYAPPSAGALTGFTPSGTVDTAPTQVTWDRDPHVLWMEIWLGQVVGPDGGPFTAFYGWVDATEVCDATTCTLALDSSVLPIPDGDYEMWMRLWGPGGFLQWTDVNGTSPAAAFTVDTSGS